MANDNKKRWRAELLNLSRKITAMVGKPIHVREVQSSRSDAVGYTDERGGVFIAQEHKLFEGLDENHKSMARLGIVVHEGLHVLMTDFMLLKRNMAGLNYYEKQLFSQLHNLCEDARIEHYADQYVGGLLLSSLKFIIAYTYKTSKPINEAKDGLSQYFSALIQFGDLGIIKGHFTDEKAHEIFIKTAPLFSQYIHEPNNRKSFSICKKIFTESKPLWEEAVKRAELMDELMKEMSKMGKNPSDSSSKASGSSPEEDGSESSADKNRSETMSRKDAINSIKSSGSGSGSGSGSKSKVEDIKTAEEAAEAAQDARDLADEAKASAKEAEDEAKSNPTSSTKAAAERAKKAAERAENAAKSAEEHAKASAEAKANGDKETEEAEAKEAGRDSIKAAQAAKNASDAADTAAGRANGSSTNDAAGAKEDSEQAENSAKNAEKSAEDAKAAAEKAEGSDGEGSGSSEAEKNAEKAAKAAERASEAAKAAKEAAKKAEEAAKAGDTEAEKAAAKEARREARKAKAAAKAAEKAANGEEYSETDEAKDAEVSDSYDNNGDSSETEYWDRTTDGARPNYEAAGSDIPDEDDEYSGEFTEFDEEDYEISDEDLKAIEKEINSALMAADRDDNEASDTSPIPDFDINISRIRKAQSCLNVRVQASENAEELSEKYGLITSKLKPGINTLTNQLKRMFRDDAEEKTYRTSGKVNVNRLNSSRMTARVFDRRRLPAEKSDVIVELLVDESGSMSGSRAEHAKQAAIALAEVMHNLKIPVYVIGFTADTSGYDCVHNHYITWKNTKLDRLKLLNITARCNNFDGYSVRYGGEILKKKAAKHKLMIVISDGQPACQAYWGVEGIADTKDAIRDVRKFASVLGVAIDNSDTDELHSMYGKDFIHISNMDNLFAGIAKKIANIMKSWE